MRQIRNRMSVVAESAGKYLWLIISIGPLFLYACSSDDTPGQTSEELLAQVTSNCGDTLPAAAYHLMNPDTLFSDPSQWAGQPAHYFAQQISKNSSEFERFKTRYESIWSTQSLSEKSILTKQLTRWCNTYSVFTSKEENYAIEELLYRLSEIEELKPIFREILGDEFDRLTSINSIDRFANLSSAQIHGLYQSIITSFSKLEEESYQQVIELIHRKL